MNDPHVVKITYQLKTVLDDVFQDTDSFKFENDSFKLYFEEQKLIVEMIDHYDNVAAARKTIDIFLRSWEINDALIVGRREFWFEFDYAELIDRNPAPPGSPNILKMTASSINVFVEGEQIVKSRKNLPQPPVIFQASPDVESLWHRYQGYLIEREPLLSMAYFCLTLVENIMGGRKNASKNFKISQSVFNNIGRLTSNRGTEKNARKIHKESTKTLLNSVEVIWIEKAVKLMIQRVGEMKSICSLSMITMDDLPPLGE